MMVKSVEYKRRVRRTQKLKKILKCKQAKCTKEVSLCPKEVGKEDQLSSETIPDMNSGEGCLDGNTSDLIVVDGDEKQQSISTSDEDQLLKAKYVTLKAKFFQTMELSQKYQKQIELDESKLKTMQEECQRKVHSVRCFWKDMIYQEFTRPGVILKRSMQKSTK